MNFKIDLSIYVCNYVLILEYKVYIKHQSNKSILFYWCFFFFFLVVSWPRYAKKRIDTIRYEIRIVSRANTKITLIKKINNNKKYLVFKGKLLLIINNYH